MSQVESAMSGSSPEGLQARLVELIETNGSCKERSRIQKLQEQEQEQRSISEPSEDGFEAVGTMAASAVGAFSADLVLRDEESGFELWLGSLEDALNIEGLRLHGINAILNCALEECENECAPYRAKLGGRRRCHARGPSAMAAPDHDVEGRSKLLDRDQIKSIALFDGQWYSDMLDCDTSFCGIAAEDKSEYAMDQHFHDAVEFLGSCREEGRRVLVHCIMGINRSSTALIAFLCQDLGMTLPDAVALCSKHRGYILSNHSFLDQLVRQYGHGDGEDHATTEECACANAAATTKATVPATLLRRPGNLVRAFMDRWAFSRTSGKTMFWNIVQ